MSKIKESTVLTDMSGYIKYIHYHPENVDSSLDLTQVYNSKKSSINAKLLSKYKSELNLALKDSSIETLSQSMSLSEAEVMKALSDGIGQAIEGGYDSNRSEALWKIENSISNDTLSKIVNENSVDELAKLFDTMKKALELVENDKEGGLGALLVASLQGGNNRAVVGKNLAMQLANYKIKNNYKSIKKQTLINAQKQLNNLASALSTGKFKSTGKDLSVEGLRSFVKNNFFSTALGETIGFVGNQMAKGTLHDAIIESVGTQSVKDDYRDRKITGKADLRIKGLNVEIAANGEKEKSKITIDVDLSEKFYAGQQLSSSNSKNFTFSSGSGGSLAGAIAELFPSNYKQANVYNYIAHEKYTKEINALILTNNLIRLLASAGGGEFNQYILVNGELISLYDIVKYVVDHNTIENFGSSRSMGGNAMGINLTISERKEFINRSKNWQGNTNPNIISALRRSKLANAQMAKTTFKAELHTQKLLNAIGSTTKKK